MCLPSGSATLGEVLATTYRASKDSRSFFLRPLESTSFGTAIMPRLPAKKQDPCHAPEANFGPTGESAKGHGSNQGTISPPAPPSLSVISHLGRTCRDGRVKVGMFGEKRSSAASSRYEHCLSKRGRSALSQGLGACAPTLHLAARRTSAVSVHTRVRNWLSRRAMDRAARPRRTGPPWACKDLPHVSSRAS
jgi:hypothetical protein